jgi:hypothetical protein
MKLTKLARINMKDDPKFNEAWLEEQISKDPSLLNLGSVQVKDRQKIVDKGGRLDILLQDIDATVRYEVEVQLGKTDESHIIRTIEYWDAEKKKYPNFEHNAVIIAEDITNRFFNVISLLNGSIPIIAYQVALYKVDENQVSLIFTKILDSVKRGSMEQDDEKEVVDRDYWEKIIGTEKTVKIADELLTVINHSLGQNFKLKYNKFYIGLSGDRGVDNIVIFKPKKSELTFIVFRPYDKEIEDKLVKLGISFLDYNNKEECFRIKLQPGDVEKHKEFIKEFISYFKK